MSDNNQSMQIYDILAEIEEAIENSPKPKLGGSANKRIVDADELFDLLGDLKVTIPEDIRRANSVLVNAQNMLDNAEEHAKELVESARNESDGMLAEAEARVAEMRAAAEAEYEAKVAENEIYLEAQKRARLLALKAEYNSQLVYDNAKRYADEILADMERFISEYQHLLEANRTELGARAMPAAEEKAAVAEEKPATPAPARKPAKRNERHSHTYADDYEDEEPEEDDEEYYDDEEEDEEEYSRKRSGGLFGFLKRKKNRNDDYDDEDEYYDDEDEDEE